MAKYTIFGDAPLPYATTVYTDGAPGIETGNIFYTTQNNGGADMWRCTGGRVWIPNNPLVTNRQVIVRAYIGTLVNGTFSPYGATPAQEKSATTPTNGGWCEVSWDTPILIDYGPDACFIKIAYEFANSADKNTYLAASGLPTTAIPSYNAGGALVLAEADAAGFYQWAHRGEYVIYTTPATPGDAGTYYCADIIMDDAIAPIDTTPVAAYGFNEASGTVITDATGNNHTLTTISQNFTANGHTDAGITAPSSAISAFTNTVDPDTYSAINIEVNPAFSVLFWGRRDNTVGGTGWVVEQTAFNAISTVWGVRLSDGTDTVFQLRPGGYETTMQMPHKPLGEWHHYALVASPYGWRCYIDGEMIEYAGIFGAYDTDNNLISFANNTTIDDLYVFDTALSAAAVNHFMTQPVASNTRSGKIKHWNGSSWQAHPVKVWNGSTWEPHAIQGTEDGSTFIAGRG